MHQGHHECTSDRGIIKKVSGGSALQAVIVCWRGCHRAWLMIEVKGAAYLPEARELQLL